MLPCFPGKAYLREKVCSGLLTTCEEKRGGPILEIVINNQGQRRFQRVQDITVPQASGTAMEESQTSVRLTGTHFFNENCPVVITTVIEYIASQGFCGGAVWCFCMSHDYRRHITAILKKRTLKPRKGRQLV